MLNIEIWKPVIGYETNYEVSNFGNVRSLNKRGNNYHHILSAHLQGNKKYLQVNLWLKNKTKKKRIHRLVAEAFIPNPNNLPEVNHIDGNRYNNHVSNLEWVTSSENKLHAFKTGLRTPSYNSLNTKLARATSKYKGVCWDKNKQKWMASCKYNRKNHYIGRFANEIDAAKARDKYIKDNNLIQFQLNFS